MNVNLNFYFVGLFWFTPLKLCPIIGALRGWPFQSLIYIWLTEEVKEKINKNLDIEKKGFSKKTQIFFFLSMSFQAWRLPFNQFWIEPNHPFSYPVGFFLDIIFPPDIGPGFHTSPQGRCVEVDGVPLYPSTYEAWLSHESPKVRIWMYAINST